MTPSKPKTGRRVLKVLALLFVLFVLIFISTPELLEAPFWLVVGWMPSLGRAWETAARFDYVVLVSAILGAVVFAVGLHLLCRWLHGHMAGDANPRRWRAVSSGALLGLLVSLFTAGICMFALAHQALWLARSPKPLFTSLRDASRAKCGSNMRQIGQAIYMYCRDHHGQYPDDLAAVWEMDLTTELFICPGSADEKASGTTAIEVAAQLAQPGHCSYIYLGRGLRDSVPSMGERPVLYEPPANHQDRGVNILFADGHVEWIPIEQAQSVLDRAAAPRPGGAP